MVLYPGSSTEYFQISESQPKFSWQSRLPRRRFVEHPTTIAEFKEWPELNKPAFNHLTFLSMCDDYLRQKWNDPWQSIFAVGPFLKRKRTHSFIPFVLVANVRKPYRHLLTLSEILTNAYLEFQIFPDLYILPKNMVVMLDEFQNINWLKTKMISIRWDHYTL